MAKSKLKGSNKTPEASQRVGRKGLAKFLFPFFRPVHETVRGKRRRPESQPESLPESLTARVIRQLMDGPMSKADLSRILGQKQISGQLNRVIRLLVADGSIGYTIPKKPRSRFQIYRLADRGRLLWNN